MPKKQQPAPAAALGNLSMRTHVLYTKPASSGRHSRAPVTFGSLLEPYSWNMLVASTL